MAPDISRYELCLQPSTDHPKCRSRSTLAHPNQIPSGLLEVLVVGSPPTMRLRRNHGAERRSPRRNPDESIRWSGRFARAPFPARPGHRPPPAPETTATSDHRADHRKGEDKRRGTTRSPLVPGRAHTGRPQTCPCGVSARDVAEEPRPSQPQGRTKRA
jgi:hypothetical protein